MDDQEAAFSAALRGVEALVNGRQRRWADALAAALELTQQYPDRVEGWHQLYLIRQLRNELDEAVEVLRQARACPGFTPVVAGDFMRDQLLGMVRRGEVPDVVDRAIEELRELHAGDSIRLACITGLAARLAYARGQYHQAAKLHAEAEQGLPPDHQWCANNMLPWLKALTMAHQHPGYTARWLRRMIAYYASDLRSEGDPLLTRAHARRAELVGRFGKLGCRIDDFLARRS